MEKLVLVGELPTYLSGLEPIVTEIPLMHSIEYLTR